MYLNCTNMYPLGFNGLIECRLLNIFEPGVCPIWMMWAAVDQGGILEEDGRDCQPLHLQLQAYGGDHW